MTMAIMYSWVFLLICPVLFLAHGSGAAVTSQDEFILVACGNRILSGNVDGSDFVEVFTHDNDIKDVDFDPVNEKVYFTDGALHTVDTDGTNYKMLFPDVDRSSLCDKPLGMEDERILDEQITASSEFDPVTHGVLNSRLNHVAGNGVRGAWIVANGDSDVNQWIQVDLRASKLVSGIVTQGAEDADRWVSTYIVAYSDDGVSFQDVTDANNDAMVFSGNSDRSTPVTNMFPTPVRTTFVRIRPQSWERRIAMRFEILGCDEIFFIDLDYKHGYLYYVEGSSIHSAPNAFRRVDLRDVVFANVQTLFPDVSTADIISYLVEDKSAVILSNWHTQSLETRDLEGNLCTNNTIWEQIGGVALNHDDATFYTITPQEDVTTINSYVVGIDNSIGPMITDTVTDGNSYRQSALTYYDGYLYVPFGDQSEMGYTSTASRLGRFSLTSKTWEYLAPSVVTDSQCQNVHIHNPFDGVETFNQGSGRKSAVVVTRQRWRGGFVADVSFKIGSNELTRIELAFPRQVYTLEIVGCDLHQRRKKQIMKTDQRKGTTYTLVPKPDSTIEAGKDGRIRFSVIGTIWRRRNGFKAPIIADVYYSRSVIFNFGSAQDASRCDS